jgi:uncharacterized protein (DUF983 family)
MKDYIFTQLEKETNLSFDNKKNVLYGTYKDYYISLQTINNQISINFPVKLSETFKIQEMNFFLTQISTEYKGIFFAAYNNNQIEIKYAVKVLPKSHVQKILDIINKLIEMASINFLSSCCPICGENNIISPFLINKLLIPCCENCKLETKNTIANEQQAFKEQKSNVLTGIVGALLGSLIGLALWVIVGLLGYIAAICGLILAICTIKGYELFGGKLNKRGILITLIITLVMVYVSQYLTLGFEIYNQFKADYAISIFDAIKTVPEALKDSDVSREFYLYLGLGYLFTLLGSFSLFKESFKQANYKIKVEEFN